jgi:hypothetical protein
LDPHKRLDFSIRPRLFSHGDGGNFSAFTDIEKKMIFAHVVNFITILSESDCLQMAIFDMHRPFTHLLENWTPPRCSEKRDVLHPIKSIRLARTALPGKGMLAKSCETM